jgi:O-antigen/teichoic acid export membrane protein
MIAIANRVSFNVVGNLFNTLLNAFCGFLILPFLIGQLGRETYGFWTLIVATVGYFLVLDLGVSGAIGRLVAAHRAKGDIAGINVVISTTTILLLAVGAAVLVLTFFIQFPFFWLFDVSDAQKPDIAKTLLVMGVGSALYFPPLAAYGMLWGYERFDAINLVEIPTVLVRTGLTLWLINSHSPLVNLAYIVVGVSIAGYAARIAMCWWVEPRLAPRPGLFSRAVAADLFVFGIWFSLLNFFRAVTPNLAPFVIGHSLGARAVTTFTIPKMLTHYTTWLMVSATQAAAPKAAVYHFGDNPQAQRELFVAGGRYSWALTLFFLGGAVFLGLPLLSLWQSARQPEEYRLLMILMLGEVIPLSQWITYNAILSMGKHRRLAMFGLCEAISILLLAYVLGRLWGLEGVACAVAVAGFVFRGVLQVGYGCQLAGLPVLDYIRAVFARIALASIPAYAAMALLRAWITPDSWLLLFAVGALYAALFWSCMAFVLDLGSLALFKLKRRPHAG